MTSGARRTASARNWRPSLATERAGGTTRRCWPVPCRMQCSTGADPPSAACVACFAHTPRLCGAWHASGRLDRSLQFLPAAGWLCSALLGSCRMLHEPSSATAPTAGCKGLFKGLGSAARAGCVKALRGAPPRTSCARCLPGTLLVGGRHLLLRAALRMCMSVTYCQSCNRVSNMHAACKMVGCATWRAPPHALCLKVSSCG